MNNLVMAGHSDDLVYATGCIGQDEFNAIKTPIRFIVNGCLFVTWRYNGVWSVELGQVDENLPIPEDWTITIEIPVDGYSMELKIDSERTPISLINVGQIND